MQKILITIAILIATSCKTIQRNPLDSISDTVEKIVENPPTTSNGWIIAIASVALVAVVSVPLYLFQSSKDRQLLVTNEFLRGVEQKPKG